jgi:hypothetical protein
MFKHFNNCNVKECLWNVLLPLSPLQVFHRIYSAVAQFPSIESNMYALNKRCFAADKKASLFLLTTGSVTY